MQSEYDPRPAGDKLEAPNISCQLRERLQNFLTPLLTQLDAQIDRRLVRTCLATIEVFLQFRHRSHGLLLSELGAYLLSPEHAPAGTKRLSNLLRSPKWHADLIASFLWQQAQSRAERLSQEGEDVLLLWDQSILEKPESIAAEGLCPVRSSKSARLKRIRPGFYHPPGGPPVFVPGLQWLCVLLIGRSGPPSVTAMRWWSTRGEGPSVSTSRCVQAEMLHQCLQTWGAQALHLWDRGYAGSPWLGLALEVGARFVMRWPKRYHLVDAFQQKRCAWQITRGKRAWDHRYLKESHRNELRKVSVLAVEVRHPDYDTPLWLVVARSGKGREPWYLLTNEPVRTSEEAWRIVLAYARRWQVEMAFRYSKSELAMESPRLWTWEGRMKLLLMVTLAYAFLLTLLAPSLEWLRTWLLRHFCHRTGKRGRETPAPLYRLRSALSRLWLAFPSASHLLVRENSG